MKIMWKILPILFNTEMVQAILSDRKTCTRRVIKDAVKENQEINKNEGKIYKPPFQPGDILYVRETWCDDRQFTHASTAGRYFYKASENGKFKWKPSIHMPKEIARIWLKVTSVRVERLQEMTDEDCEKEGLENACKKCESHLFNCDICMNNDGIKEEFKELWDSAIKKADIDKYGWSATRRTI